MDSRLLDRSQESSSEVLVDNRSLLLLDRLFLLVDGMFLQLLARVFLLSVLVDRKFEPFLPLIWLLMLVLRLILLCVLVLVDKRGMEELKEFFFFLKRRFMLRRPSSGLENGIKN